MPWTLVTGGAKRLGAEICRTLAQNGYPVVIHYNKSRDEALDVAQSCRNSMFNRDIVFGHENGLDSRLYQVGDLLSKRAYLTTQGFLLIHLYYLFTNQ